MNREELLDKGSAKVQNLMSKRQVIDDAAEMVEQCVRLEIGWRQL
jgi:hypothetical protein